MTDLADARRVAVVDGRRTPFFRAGEEARDLTAVDLARPVLARLGHDLPCDRVEVDRVVLGRALGDGTGSDLARTAVLAADWPPAVPAQSIGGGCLAGLAAISNAAEAIAAGQIEVAVAGGVESWSEWWASPQSQRPPDRPEAAGFVEPATNQRWGQAADRLAKRLGISRQDQDEYAAVSHARAAEARATGRLSAQIAPLFLPPGFEPLTMDTGRDLDEGSLGKLPPVFDPDFGSVTRGNSFFAADGAAMVVLAAESRVRDWGLTPLGFLKVQAAAAGDPLEEQLLGAVLATSLALDRAGIELADLGVIEVHEGFAVQVIAWERLLASDDFAAQRLGRAGAVGRVDRDRLNRWGGSLSLGHPLGATGGRLVLHALHRMAAEGADLGLVAVGGAGASGRAMILERS